MKYLQLIERNEKQISDGYLSFSYNINSEKKLNKIAFETLISTY